MQDIKKYFDKAKLPLFVTNKSIGRFSNEAGDKIFQMTIDRPGNKSEFFRVFKGGVKNDIRVLDVDSKKSQLLLYVKEPRRVFKTKHSEWDKKMRRNSETETEHVTPEGIRRYLMGMDERHLFISELV